jgi:hypothetical protein
MIPSSAEPYTWICTDADYLRQQAHRCVRLARGCRDSATTDEIEAIGHELEAIGNELMEKARELEVLQQDRGADQSSRE